MKKLTTLLLLTLSIVGCKLSTEEFKKQEVARFEIYTIDSCQYIYRSDGYNLGGMICHKGNCNNPIHKK